MARRAMAWGAMAILFLFIAPVVPSSLVLPCVVVSIGSAIAAVWFAWVHRREHRYSLEDLRALDEAGGPPPLDVGEPDEDAGVVCPHCGTVYAAWMLVCPNCGR